MSRAVEETNRRMLRARDAIFSTDDCRKTYETLLQRGVEITEEPTERPYGIDCALRDPFGNHLRFNQPKA